MSEQLHDYFGEIFQRYFRSAVDVYPQMGGALVERLLTLTDHVPDRLAQTRCAALAWAKAEIPNARIASELFVITQHGLMYAAGFDESRRALYYLATPPALFDPFVDQVDTAEPHECAVVVVDGRFGRDLTSAHPMDAALRRILDEHLALRGGSARVAIFRRGLLAAAFRGVSAPRFWVFAMPPSPQLVRRPLDTWPVCTQMPADSAGGAQPISGGPGNLSTSTFPSKARSAARSEWLYWRRSRGGHHLVTTGPGSSSPRCSPRGWWLRAITSRCSPPPTRSPRPPCAPPRCVGWSEDATIDAKVAECLHIASVFERADEFDIIHNGFDFLPLTYSDLVATPLVTTIHGFSSDRIIPVYERYDGTSERPCRDLNMVLSRCCLERVCCRLSDLSAQLRRLDWRADRPCTRSAGATVLTPANSFRFVPIRSRSLLQFRSRVLTSSDGKLPGRASVSIPAAPLRISRPQA